MKRKVRKKPEKEEEQEPVILVVDKEKEADDKVKKEKMTPIEKERQGMKPSDLGEAMNPIKN